jgi:hypothetical protein
MIDRYRQVAGGTQNSLTIRVPHQLWRAWRFRAATLLLWNVSARASAQLAGLEVKGAGEEL